jgi:hypothetical protein
MRRSVLSALLGLALLAGCSSGDDDSASPGTTTTTRTTTAAAPSTSGATGAGTAGCPAAGGERPSGVPATADSKQTLDVDGDGRPDTVYIDDETGGGGGVPFGIVTASGADFFENFASASPVGRSVLVADVTGKGEFVALASDGRAVKLWAISDCSFVPVQNAQGQQYTFDLGFTGFGTGVGCADVDGDGVRDLVGLQVDGTSLTSTVVQLEGARATNGTSTTIADASPALVDSAHQVTCGDLTMAANGVSTGP